ncbi:hypothetical protein AGMMS49990_10710 [Endomicrobiia bacterium]|nr:hypothetical protein AGMMS49990_10710 [Endomicrobiia bacterium]
MSDVDVPAGTDLLLFGTLLGSLDETTALVVGGLIEPLDLLITDFSSSSPDLLSSVVVLIFDNGGSLEDEDDKDDELDEPDVLEPLALDEPDEGEFVELDVDDGLPSLLVSRLSFLRASFLFFFSSFFFFSFSSF